MATQVSVVWTCDKCQERIEDEGQRVSLRIQRSDTDSDVLELDFHEGCVDPLYLPDELVRPTRMPRRRRTREEMIDAHKVVGA